MAGRRPLSVLSLVLLLLALAPLAAAHAAPPARAFETRILHDHNDDSAIVLAGKHGFDAIALDVREAWLPGQGNALVLRLLLNGGCNADLPTACPALREVVSFEAPGGAAEVTFETSDGGATWSGSAATYVGPESLNDGTRFAIEGWVPFASFGGSPGATLESWFVHGYAGEEPADDMPAGAVPGLPDPLGAAFDAGSYVLGAPDGYMRAEPPTAPANGTPGATVDLPFRLANLVALPQDATFAVNGTAVVLSGGTSVDALALAPNFTADLVLRVTLPNGTAPVNVTVTSTLGGVATFVVPATGQAAVSNTTTDHDHDHTETGDGKDAPFVGLQAVLAALCAVALARRRR